MPVPLLNLVNDSAIRALANSPAMGAAQGLAMKIAFPYGGPAGHGHDVQRLAGLTLCERDRGLAAAVGRDRG